MRIIRGMLILLCILTVSNVDAAETTGHLDQEAEAMRVKGFESVLTPGGPCTNELVFSFEQFQGANYLIGCTTVEVKKGKWVVITASVDIQFLPLNMNQLGSNASELHGFPNPPNVRKTRLCTTLEGLTAGHVGKKFQLLVYGHIHHQTKGGQENGCDFRKTGEFTYQP